MKKMETGRIILPGTGGIKRSRQEILQDTLQVIASGVVKPTRIMYKANLSWNVLTNTLEYALERKLINVSLVGEGRRYSLTDEGRKYIALIESAAKMLHEA